jgi:hypothetical protein
MIAVFCLVSASSIAVAAPESAVLKAYAGSGGQVHFVTGDGVIHTIAPRNSTNAHFLM